MEGFWGDWLHFVRHEKLVSVVFRTSQYPEKHLSIFRLRKRFFKMTFWKQYKEIKNKMIIMTGIRQEAYEKRNMRGILADASRYSQAGGCLLYSILKWTATPYAWKAYSENRLPIFKIAKCFEQNAQDICVCRKKVVTLPPFCREDICAHEHKLL